MNTYYVPMEHDIPHAETTRYERKRFFILILLKFIVIIIRYAEILSMVTIYSSIYGTLFLFSTYALEIIK